MLISASIGRFLSKDAEGSGIPEMKSILAGVNIYKFLSYRAMIGKIIGVWANFCAHLSIGKEGPFVHISACIANNLAKLSFFRDINSATKKNMLAAAVGAGVTATFGTPIGGVLFSIEVTSSYYIVANLWRTFFCSVFTIIVYCFFRLVSKFELFGVLHLNEVEVDL